MTSDAPHHVRVRAGDLGLVIGRGGSTIEKITAFSRCRIQLPQESRCSSSSEDTLLLIKLCGSSESRALAAEAIQGVLRGEDVEDLTQRGDGALLVRHSLEEPNRRRWAGWRFASVEHEHHVYTEVGRNSVRIWAIGKPIVGEAARAIRTAADQVLAEAAKTLEVNVNVRAECAVNSTGAVCLLSDQYGVLVFTSPDFAGTLRVLGPPAAAKDAAAVLEARCLHGHCTACVLHVPRRIAFQESMVEDFARDVATLEEEHVIKVFFGTTIMWISGASEECVETGKRILRKILMFYLPKEFLLLEGLKSVAVERLRADKELRHLRATLGCAVALDTVDGTAWICGTEARESVRRRIDEVLREWSAEYQEMVLNDFSDAMWLLGPRGTGEHLLRIQSESGACVRVCPNKLKVWIEGQPLKVEAARRLVLEALRQLQVKRIEGSGPEARNRKRGLSEPPLHMRAVLQQLAEFEDKERAAAQRRRAGEREHWIRTRDEAVMGDG